jgi:hypothetical protein
MNSAIDLSRLPLLSLAVILAAGARPTEAADAKRWTDDELVASYQDLASAGGLEAAILNPVLPKDPPQPAFLEALAWFAAGTPSYAGSLTADQLESFVQAQARSYGQLLKAKAQSGAENDYPRTRTWKVVQKLTLLRNEMSRPERAGSYPYRAISMAPSGDDPWEREHTLRSREEFGQKVCEASRQRPVLVKFGNTNCTQCMLFEMIGSVKEFAENPAHKGVDVYKVWWGFRPDDSFAGRIRNPERLDDLVKAEGVRSSPTFVVYRNGRRISCGDAFPDLSGSDEHLESCLKQDFAEAPAAVACGPAIASQAPSGGGR